MSYFCRLVFISSKYIYLIEEMFEASEGTFLCTYIWTEMYCGEQENINREHDKKEHSRLFPGTVPLNKGLIRTIFIRI
jgi:hypothetical protein